MVPIEEHHAAHHEKHSTEHHDKHEDTHGDTQDKSGHHDAHHKPEDHHAHDSDHDVILDAHLFNEGEIAGGQHKYGLDTYPFMGVDFFDESTHDGKHVRTEPAWTHVGETPEQCGDPCGEIREERDWYKAAYEKLLAKQ